MCHMSKRTIFLIDTGECRKCNWLYSPIKIMQNRRNPLAEELAKDCRTVEDIQEKLKNLFRDAIQQVFEGEIEDHLGYSKQDNDNVGYPGWPYIHLKSIPDSVIHYISKQIGTTPSSLSHYPQRENTLWDHLKEIRSEYEFVTFTLKEYRMTFKHLH